MPWLLRTLAAASVGIGIAFSILPFLPGATFGLGARELTVQELWQTKIAFSLFVVGPLMFAVGVAIFLRKSWIRPVLVFLPLLQLLPFLAVHWAFGAPSPVSSFAIFAVSCLVWAALAAAYLLGSRRAREHFANAG